MLQSLRREIGGEVSFPQLAELAKSSGPPLAIVNVNDNAFMAPDSMIETVKQAAQ